MAPLVNPGTTLKQEPVLHISAALAPSLTTLPPAWMGKSAAVCRCFPAVLPCEDVRFRLHFSLWIRREAAQSLEVDAQKPRLSETGRPPAAPVTSVNTVCPVSQYHSPFTALLSL